MRPDPNNAIQMRQFVFPGTWNNFNTMRYAGVDEAMLELQLAKAYGLRGLVQPGDPDVVQYLRDKLEVGDANEEDTQQGGLQQ